MKELNIEEKAKAYDEALKVLHKYDGANIMFSQSLKEEMFPELKESEDEKIRLELMQYLRLGNGRIYNYSVNTYIKWLEKQGEQNYKIIKGKNYFCTKTHNYAGVEWIKGTKYYASDNYTLVNQGCEYFSPEYSKEEHNNLFEEVKCDGCVENQAQKPADETEPKYEVGDWLIHNEKKYIVKVTRITPCYYDVVDTCGYYSTLSITYIKDNYHLWTIQDAKDGDVLALNGEVFIYAHRKQLYSIAVAHCFVDSVGGFYFDGEFGYTEKGNPIHPATKEQRDTLMKAMKKDAGYTFDFEKKELRKIEHNSAWSEEDEKLWLDAKSLAYEVEDRNLVCWIMSIKDRVQLQNGWRPSDEQMSALYEETQKSDRIKDYRIVSLYNDLKKLMEE